MTSDRDLAPRAVVARAARRSPAVRPLPARLQAARRPARPLLRAPAQRRRDGADDVRAFVRLLRRPDREEAAEPLLSGHARCCRSARPAATWRASSARTGTSRSRRDMDRLMRRGVARGDRRGRGRARAAAASRSPTTIRSSSPSTRSTPPGPAARAGIKTVAVTAGYIHAEPRRAFFEVMDAANVDLKAFTDDFYFKLTGAHLQPVLDTLRYLVRETGVLDRDHDAADSREERLGRRAAPHERLDRRRTRPAGAAALHGVPSRLQARRRAGDTGARR